MTVGDSETLTATVTPSNATDKTVTWSSSKTTVATVSSSGVVTAKAVGTATITVTTNDGAKTATCAVTVKAATVFVTGVSLNKSSLSMTVGDTETLTATVTPSNATDKSVTWASSKTSVATVSSNGVVTAKSAGTATITVKTTDGSKTATCSVTVDGYNGYEYVDLGLPSGLKWAAYNVGATSPEELGDYFAWGETEPKEDYSWATYKWCLNADAYNLTKYNDESWSGSVDNKSELELSDDAAHVNWGGSWRTPTCDEILELANNTTSTRTTVNGVSGTLLKSNKNGATVFFPDTGYINGSERKSGSSNTWSATVGHQYYWSHDYYHYPKDAFFFDPNYWATLSYSPRAYGFPVRAVSY